MSSTRADATHVPPRLPGSPRQAIPLSRRFLLPLVLMPSLGLVSIVTSACKKTSPGGASGLAADQSGGFLVYANSPAALAAKQLHAKNDANAATIDAIAANTVAVWYTGAASDLQNSRTQASAALASDATAAMVLYNIPARDCGSYSAGGVPASQYQEWVAQIASAIGSAKALVVLEPDALAGADCLNSKDQATRLQLLSYAVTQLKAQPNTRVYIDAGHPGWQSASTIASRLQAAGIAQADGFALNTANYIDSAANVAYGNQIAATTGKHFIIDTSRNGNGDNGQWCNPEGRAIGQVSTQTTGLAGVDAFLWVQLPGASDGPCNGGPAAGNYWPARAVQLAQAANFPAVKSYGAPTGSSAGDNASSTNASSGGSPIAAPGATGAVQATGNAADNAASSAANTSGANSVTNGPAGAYVNPSVASPSSPAGPSLQVSLSTTTTTDHSYCAVMTILNSGSAPTTTWSVVLDLHDATLNQEWNLNEQDTPGATAKLMPFNPTNAVILPGSTATQQGFCAALPSGGTPATINSVSAD